VLGVVKVLEDRGSSTTGVSKHVDGGEERKGGGMKQFLEEDSTV